MTQKNKKSEKENHNPTLVYLCGKGNTGIRQTIMEELSKTCFISASAVSQKIDFTSSCYAITSSSAFVFIMDSTSVLDIDCLSLLGTAIAFDVPVIGIREAGYALPYEIPKLFGKIEIVDRSRPFEYKLACKNLPAVTTLASALKVLFTQSVIYHERIKDKCVKEITSMLCGVRMNRVIPKKFEHFEESTGSIESGSEANGSEIDIKGWPPQANDREHLPDVIQHNKRNTAASRKTPEQRKPLGPSPPNIIKPVSRQNSKKVMSISKCKIRVHSPEKDDPGFSLTSEKSSPTKSDGGEDKEKSKPRANTVHTNSSKNNEKNKPYHKLRRLSSLPCIKTNYMVTSEEQRSQPKIYHFPMSPRLEKRSSNLNGGHILDDEEDRLHLSRTCSPIDFASDDGALSPG